MLGQKSSGAYATGSTHAFNRSIASMTGWLSCSCRLPFIPRSRAWQTSEHVSPSSTQSFSSITESCVHRSATAQHGPELGKRTLIVVRRRPAEPNASLTDSTPVVFLARSKVLIAAFIDNRTLSGPLSCLSLVSIVDERGDHQGEGKMTSRASSASGEAGFGRGDQVGSSCASWVRRSGSGWIALFNVGSFICSLQPSRVSFH